MKLTLRIVAVVFAVATFATGSMLISLIARGKLLTLARAGPIGVWTLTGWGFILALGLPAAVQLWRLRPSGPILGALLAASSLGYYLLGPLLARQQGLAGRYTPQVLVGIAGNAALAVLLVSSAARRACQIGARALESSDA